MFDLCLQESASHSRASGSASLRIQARPPFPAPWALSLFPHSRLLEKEGRGTSAPPPGPGSEPRRTARDRRWAAGAAASGSRRHHCNGHRRLHLLLPQRPLRRESYITCRQSLLGNVVPPGSVLKGDRWLPGVVEGTRSFSAAPLLPFLGKGRESSVLGGARALELREGCDMNGQSYQKFRNCRGGT